MRLLDLSLTTPAANLACDEALLEQCENGEADETLRFWESSQHFVALGYTNRVSKEVRADADIPILRRCSGGGTVLQGPGCFNYALLLRIPKEGDLAGVTSANNFIMHRHEQALGDALNISITREGFTDLATRDLKFSGNAQRRKQKFLLFHGTFLLDFDLSLVEAVLLPPPKQPNYRKNRTHQEFVTNLKVSRDAIKAILRRAWNANESSNDWPRERVLELVEKQYCRSEWNLKF